MCNLLIRSWGDLSESDKNQRNFLVKLFFDTLTKNYRELTPNSNEETVKQVVVSTLPCLSQIIDFCKHHSSSSKKLLHSGIHVRTNFIKKYITVITCYIKNIYICYFSQPYSTHLQFFHIMLTVQKLVTQFWNSF